MRFMYCWGTRPRRVQPASSSPKHADPLGWSVGCSPSEETSTPRRSVVGRETAKGTTLAALLPCWLRTATQKSGNERGSGTILMIGVIAALFAMAVGGAVVAAWFATAQQARNTADLAASAAAQAQLDGHSACETGAEVARKNGARLMSCRVNGNSQAFDVLIEVRVDLLPRVPGFPAEVVGRARAGTIG